MQHSLMLNSGRCAPGGVQHVMAPETGALSLIQTRSAAPPHPMFCPQDSKSFPFCNCCITYGSCASKGDAPGMKHECEVTQLAKK